MVHRRSVPREVTSCHRIPVTAIADTLVDVAQRLSSSRLEAAVNEADKLDLIDPEELRAHVASMPPRPGTGIVGRLLDRRTFTLTDSELERHFVPIGVRAVGSMPLTGAVVNGFKVDFYWPDLGLVVETDGLRYHRNPGQQENDRRRDQAHIAAGLTPLRFTHGQVYHQPDHVENTLVAVARRLRGARAASGA
jgi:very-short-patch-repair endonuclease